MPSKSIAEICESLAAHTERFQAIASGQGYMLFLPLLEHPLHEVQRQLQPCLTAAGLPAEIRNAVSLEELVRFALGSWGSHWPELAVSSLEGGLPTNNELGQALESLSQNKSLPRSLRHRAFALAKAWAKGNQGQAPQ